VNTVLSSMDVDVMHFICWILSTYFNQDFKDGYYLINL